MPPDLPRGLDTPLPPPPPINWDGLGDMIPVNPTEETKDGDDAEVPQNENVSTTWHDVALSIAAELMQKAREEVYTKLGYSTSAVSCYAVCCRLGFNCICFFVATRASQEISF